MHEPATFFADALELADTGAFRNAAKMRIALLLLSRNAAMTDDLLDQADLRRCLDARCQRAAASTITVRRRPDRTRR
jgi:hypothetical protein